MLANVLTIVLKGVNYGIGVFDGASDTPIFGMTFNYYHENNIEFLTLFVTKPLRLTTSAYLFNRGNISYHEASKNEKSITVLPGSTIIMTIKKYVTNNYFDKQEKTVHNSTLEIDSFVIFGLKISAHRKSAKRHAYATYKLETL